MQQGLAYLSRILIVKKVKYLGYSLSSSQKQYHSALANIKREVNIIKSKLSLKNEAIQKLEVADSQDH